MDKESYPENWSTGIIAPIFKKGDRTLPKNYRGITLLPTMGKIFTSNNILHILQDMYLKATSRVKVNGALTNPFSCDIGVRQGCNLSPLLFICL